MTSWRQLAEERLGELQSTIALRRESSNEEGLNKARKLMLSGRGRQAMEDIRAVFAEIQDHQHELLTVRERDASERAAATHDLILAGHLLAIGMLLLAGVAMRADRRRRSEAELQLETSEERLSAIVDTAMDAIIVIDANEKITFVNPAAEALFGCDQHLAVGVPIRRFIPATHRGSFADELAEFVQSTELNKRLDERAAERADGREIRVACALTKSEVDEKPFVTLMLRDLSEREAQRAKIREQSAVLDQVRDAIHICDSEGQVVYWNHGAEALYGWTAAEATGRQASEMIVSANDDAALESVRRTLEDSNWSGELSQRTKNGREIIVEERRTLIHDESGGPTAQLVIDVDVTERKRAEEHQRRSQRLESIGTLAGGIAHDLNNVLTPILMGAKLLARESTRREAQQDRADNSVRRRARCRNDQAAALVRGRQGRAPRSGVAGRGDSGSAGHLEAHAAQVDRSAPRRDD